MNRVAVVGAGTAGLAAAVAAAERGARVTLLEAGNRLPLQKSSWPSLLHGDARQLPMPDERVLTRKGIEVALGQRVPRIGDAPTLTLGGKRSEFEAVVLSTGSAPTPVKVEGMRKRGVHVLDSESAFAGLREKLRDYGKASVCGSGPVAVEVAEKLRAKGVAVMLFCPGGALPMLNEAPRQIVLDALSSWGVSVSAANVDKIVGVERVEAVMAAGEVHPCDSCVILPRTLPQVPEMSAGLGRSGGLVVDESMRSSRRWLYGAGDCAELPVGAATLSVMFESSANLMGRVAGANAAGAKLSARVVGSFFKEMVGVGVASAGLGLAEAAGVGLDVAEASRTWKGNLACSIVFEKGTKSVVGVQMAGRDVARYSGTMPLIVASRATLSQLAYQESMASSDISPISETATEGVRNA